MTVRVLSNCALSPSKCFNDFMGNSLNFNLVLTPFIIFILIVAGCSPQEKVIKVEEKEYSREQMKGFLYKLWFVEEYRDKKPFLDCL